MVCSEPAMHSDTKSAATGITALTIDQGLTNFEFTYSAPQFCDWRKNVRDRPNYDRLLMREVGNCMNLTTGYWTYEYCHPDSLTQFHLEPDGKIDSHFTVFARLGKDSNVLDGKFDPEW